MNFRREQLPPAETFYRSEFDRLSRPSRGWARTRCPLHGGDNPTSFSVNLETGGFYCHSCGAKGGDLVDYVQARDHCDFPTACKTLGCWDETGTPTKLVRTVVGKDLIMSFVVDGVVYRAKVNDDNGPDYLDTWFRKQDTNNG
jgi:hypothetical protein